MGVKGGEKIDRSRQQRRNFLTSKYVFPYRKLVFFLNKSRGSEKKGGGGENGPNSFENLNFRPCVPEPSYKRPGAGRP